MQGSGGIAAPAQGPARVWHGQALPPRRSPEQKNTERKNPAADHHRLLLERGGREGRLQTCGFTGGWGSPQVPRGEGRCGVAVPEQPPAWASSPQPHCPAAAARLSGRQCRGAGGCGCFPASRPGVAEPRRADNRLWLFSHPAGIRLHGPGIFFPSFHSLSLETFRILPLISPLCLPSRSAQTGLEAEVSAFSIPNTQKHQ